MQTPPARKPARITPNLPFLLVMFAIFISVAASADIIHDLDVELRPETGYVEVRDRIGVPYPTRRFEFVLNAGFEIETTVGTLKALQTSPDGNRIAYRVDLPTASRTLELHYHGQPRFSQRRSMGGMPEGEVSTAAVYLDGSSAWYPMLDGAIAQFSMNVKLPEDWQSISIGKKGEKDALDNWSSEQPHDDIYLIAGRFVRHAREHGDTTLSVWLLEDDPALAERYLQLGAEYIDFYSRLIGAYPFRKFAVVENRWQTGFGMPSFTLLGSRVMRLPFIPFTSLPHEILHNWWGNGVWIDHAKGNWSEGLTAYLADHWMKERRGQGAAYRLKALQRYSNFAADGKDSPLIGFVSRHSDASQSIGYSKSLMLFHMLRTNLGDAAFVDALRRLWQKHRFTAVGFEQVIATLTSTDPSLRENAEQWLYREGAPRITLGESRVIEGNGGYRLQFELRQDEPAFDVRVPVAITLDGEAAAVRHIVVLDSTRRQVELDFSQRPLRIDVDPEYDVLRYLDPSEQPPALNRLFGTKALLVLPTDVPAAQRQAWKRLASGWQRRYGQLEVVDDSRLDSLPGQVDVLIAGWTNRWLAAARPALARGDQHVGEHGVGIGDARYPSASHTSVLVNTDADGKTTGFIGAESSAGIAMMARKLPHYGSFGRLVFDGESGNNLLKEALTSDHAVLSRQLAGQDTPLSLAPRPPLESALPETGTDDR